MSGVRESIGKLVGAAWSAPVAAISGARRARMFHPRGVAFEAEVREVAASRYALLGERLAGPALARLSGALFKQEVQRFEVLGLALRFGFRGNVEPAEGEQDLLLATIISPLTMPLSPFTTRSDDFLANSYWGVSPFEVEGLGRMKFRATPLDVSPPSSAGRDARLLQAVEAGHARFSLEARPTLKMGWVPFATVELKMMSPVDQEALRFNPFRAGKGIEPAGLVHAIRRDVYKASQDARPTSR